MSLSREYPDDHRRFFNQTIGNVRELVAISESAAGSVLGLGSDKRAAKFAPHDTLNAFHTNEFCGIPKTLPVGGYYCNDLRLSDEVRCGAVGEWLVHEKKVGLEFLCAYALC